MRFCSVRGCSRATKSAPVLFSLFVCAHPARHSYAVPSALAAVDLPAPGWPSSATVCGSIAGGTGGSSALDDVAITALLPPVPAAAQAPLACHGARTPVLLPLPAAPTLPFEGLDRALAHGWVRTLAAVRARAVRAQACLEAARAHLRMLAAEEQWAGHHPITERAAKAEVCLPRAQSITRVASGGYCLGHHLRAFLGLTKGREGMMFPRSTVVAFPGTHAVPRATNRKEDTYVRVPKRPSTAVWPQSLRIRTRGVQSPNTKITSSAGPRLSTKCSHPASMRRDN